MTAAERIHQLFVESAQIKLAAGEVLAEPIAQAAERIVQSLMAEGKVLACGNGGATADAQRFAAKLVNRYERDRPGLAAIALTADTTILTAIANDSDYAQVFARQINALGQPGDILLAISSSGNSENVLEAARAAHDKDMSVVALTGPDGGELGDLLDERDILIPVPADSVARVQEVHLLAVHCLCDSIDYLLLGA
jgi:D-sedoheptulose 7-phosphate isomerase